jgi:hypothetical protein
VWLISFGFEGDIEADFGIFENLYGTRDDTAIWIFNKGAGFCISPQ